MYFRWTSATRCSSERLGIPAEFEREFSGLGVSHVGEIYGSVSVEIELFDTFLVWSDR